MMRSIPLWSFVFTVGLLLSVGSSGGTPPATLLFGPYPQQAQTDSVMISWMTVLPTKSNEVHWAENISCGLITSEENLFPCTFHTVKLQGLTAARQYHYNVVSDGTTSLRYTFWTAFPRNDTIRFVVYGDSQGVWDDWQKVRAVSEAIEQEQPPFVLKTGDFVDEGWDKSLWVAYFGASPFLHNSTLYPVLGNHENQSILYYSYFSIPLFKPWYSFENGPVRFLGLSSVLPDRYRIIQHLWLCHTLQTSDAPFTIVFFHHPLYSSSNHGNSTFLQRIWGPVFDRYHVDLVFSGHDHNYERSIVDNVTYIVTGGGGSHLYDCGHSPWTVYSEKTYHYCLLTVNATTLLFEAKKPNGLVFDFFSLIR